MKYQTHNGVWTDERVTLLKQLWAADELPCSRMAEQLGGGITRNAVIGKARRIGLPMKGKSVPTVDRVPKQRRAYTPRSIRKNGAGYVEIDTADAIDADPKSVAELEAQPTPETFLGTTFAKLNEDHCRYIRTIDNVNLYCGQPKINGSSYCRDCHRRCHTRANAPSIYFGRRAA